MHAVSSKRLLTCSRLRQGTAPPAMESAWQQAPRMSVPGSTVGVVYIRAFAALFATALGKAQMAGPAGSSKFCQAAISRSSRCFHKSIGAGPASSSTAMPTPQKGMPGVPVSLVSLYHVLSRDTFVRTLLILERSSSGPVGPMMGPMMAPMMGPMMGMGMGPMLRAER